MQQTFLPLINIYTEECANESNNRFTRIHQETIFGILVELQGWS